MRHIKGMFAKTFGEPRLVIVAPSHFHQRAVAVRCSVLQCAAVQ